MLSPLSPLSRLPSVVLYFLYFHLVLFIHHVCQTILLFNNLTTQIYSFLHHKEDMCLKLYVDST